tara:strand:- start:1392 stop:1994 length:603 start_codon:yes stop_codon:yes gene_type:complete
MKALIVGAGDSLDIEVVKNFDGMIICSDIVTHLVDDIRKIDYAVTLEDSIWYVDGHFAGKYNHEFPIITSNRTQQPTKDRLSKRFKLIPFITPFSHATWNVGMMGWIFAWKELNIKDITLTGFDSLESPRHPEHKIWKETLQEINKIFTPSDVITKHMGKEVERVSKGNIPSDLNKYILYRSERDGKLRKLIYNSCEGMI